MCSSDLLRALADAAFRVEMLAVTMFVSAMLLFEKMLREAIFALEVAGMLRVVVVTAFRVVTLVVERLELLVTFKLVPKILVVVNELSLTIFANEITEGRSPLVSKRNDGAPAPNSGPEKM